MFTSCLRFFLCAMGLAKMLFLLNVANSFKAEDELILRDFCSGTSLKNREESATFKANRVRVLQRLSDRNGRRGNT